MAEIPDLRTTVKVWCEVEVDGVNDGRQFNITDEVRAMQTKIAKLKEALKEARGALDEIAHFDPVSEYGAPGSAFEQHGLPHVQSIALAALEAIGANE